jgi:flagellar FliL protein
VAQEAAAAEPQEKKKLPIVKIAIMVVGALVLVGAGVAGGIFFVKFTKPAEENPLAIVIERKADDAKDGQGKDGKDAKKDGKDAAPAAAGAKPVPQTEKFVTTYFEFPGNFTTNLKGSRRFVQVSLGLSTQYDRSVIENVQKHEVAIRAEVLAVLGEQSEAEIVGMENRKRLQNLLRDAINKVLTERVDFGGVANVYVTALVMQ